MENVAPLLNAIAALLWVIFAFTALFVLKPEITRVFGRLKKAEILGQKIELEDELVELQASAVATEKEVQELNRQVVLDAEPTQVSIQTGTVEFRVERKDTLEVTIQSLLKLAEADPKIALMALAAELEKQARHALATRGVLGERYAVSLREALTELSRYGFPQHLSDTLRLFQNVRNKIIHGMSATNADALSALDSGIIILRALNALPNETNVVFHPGVEIFLDENCTRPIVDARAVILQTTSPGGSMKEFRIFPTTRNDYKEGKIVSWSWNMQKVWPETWYRDPETGAIRKAWEQSAEFTGRHLDDI